MRPEEDYFSPGFWQFMQTIHPYQRMERIRFPSSCRNMRIGKHEKVHDWFNRLVEGDLGGSVNGCAMEPNMAVFAEIGFSPTHISSLGIQVIIASEKLEVFRDNQSIPCSYFRLDYHLKCLGSLFKEPQPHIHTAPDGEPRFWLGTGAENGVVEFFDFIYRNYHYEKWIEWARNAYRRENGSRNPEEVFEPIEEAFTNNMQQAIASDYSSSINEIRIACHTLRDKLYPMKIDTAVTSAFSY